jgi:polar amino acid transport system permease protein
VLISLVSTGVVFRLAAWWIGSSEQWPIVQRQFFSWDAITESFPDVLGGFWLNMRIFLVSEVFILIVALVLAVMRSISGPVAAPFRFAATFYIDTLRGIPALLLILLLGFGVPALQLPGFPKSATFWGTVAMIAGYSAYTAEVYRAGMEAVHDSQRQRRRGTTSARGILRRREEPSGSSD